MSIDTCLQVLGSSDSFIYFIHLLHSVRLVWFVINDLIKYGWAADIIWVLFLLRVSLITSLTLYRCYKHLYFFVLNIIKRTIIRIQKVWFMSCFRTLLIIQSFWAIKFLSFYLFFNIDPAFSIHKGRKEGRIKEHTPIYVSSSLISHIYIYSEIDWSFGLICDCRRLY